MNVLIVDDEKPARDRMVSMVLETPDYRVCAVAANGIEAVRAAEQFKPDIALMDIRMPEMDGLEAARHMSEMEEPPAVIFATAFHEHALEAFDTQAVAYLLKPIRQEKLREALEKATKLNRAQLQYLNGPDQKSRSHICARVRGNLELIPLTDIYYFQADQKYVTVRHSRGEVLIEEPLKQLEDEFTAEFMRIHRNALVSKSRIAGMNKTTEGRFLLVMNEIKDSLEISRRHVSEVRRFLKQQ
ncbi:MAG: LytR/AlgR family response regulator transcription factor [Thiotrichales bacterium]